MFLLLVVGFTVCFFVFSDQKKRIDALEREVQNLTAYFSRQGSVPLQQQNVTIPQVIEPIPEQTNVFPQTVETPNLFIEWLKKDLFMKLGALFLLMGLGWFVSYAFMNDWIGEAGRIALGLLTGSLFLLLGFWRIKTHEHQGAVFTVLGSSTVLLTVFAARELYGFFTPVTALFIMFLSVVFVTFVSLMYNRNSLALAGLILAAIAPYFTNSPTPLIFEQFFYLFTIVLGTLWIVYYTGWRNLTATALVIVFLQTLPYVWMGGSERFLVLLFVFLFVATFFVANIISILRIQGAVLSQTHLFTAFGTALFLILWVFSVAPENLQSLIFVAWMLAFSFGAYIVYLGTNERIPFYVYGATSIALLGAATTAELSGPVLIIAYTFEIASVIVVATMLHLNKRVASSLSLLFAVPMLLSLESMVSYSWNSGIIHGDFFVILILSLVLAIVGLFMREQAVSSGDQEQSGMTLIFFGVAYGLALVWLVLHALFFDDDLATMLSLTVYTILGLISFFLGKVKDDRGMKIVGGVLLGLVAGRLLIVDVWAMDLFGKIITFLVIGTLFVSTAFFGKSDTQKTVIHQ